jgi:hypothetical protein
MDDRLTPAAFRPLRRKATRQTTREVAHTSSSAVNFRSLLVVFKDTASKQVQVGTQAAAIVTFLTYRLAPISFSLQSRSRGESAIHSVVKDQ